MEYLSLKTCRGWQNLDKLHYYTIHRVCSNAVIKFQPLRNTTQYCITRWTSFASAFNPQVGTVAVGGSAITTTNNPRINNVTITRDYGMTWEELAPFPYSDWRGVDDGELLFVNDTLLLFQSWSHVTHGYKRGSMFFFDLESNTWSEGPQWRYTREYNLFGVVTRESGEKEIVNVGGAVRDDPHDGTPFIYNNYNRFNLTRSVEIYNLNTRTVRDGKNQNNPSSIKSYLLLQILGPDAPFYWAKGAMIPYLDTFLLLSPYQEDTCCEWTTTTRDDSRAIWK